MGALLRARLLLAFTLLLVAVMSAPFVGYVAALAGIAGIAIMVCNGPLTFFRAQSKLAAFTLSAILVQAGLGLPRLAGLLVGGVTGCIVVLAI